MAGLLNRLLGNKGERRAAKFLRGRGFRILDRQNSGRLGEIDLIADDGGTIVFVEVKTRRSNVAGHPVEAILSRPSHRPSRRS
jgi:putative endonuclease